MGQIWANYYYFTTLVLLYSTLLSPPLVLYSILMAEGHPLGLNFETILMAFV